MAATSTPTPQPQQSNTAARPAAQTNQQQADEKVAEAMNVQDDAQIVKGPDLRRENQKRKAVVREMKRAVRKDYKKLYYILGRKRTMQDREEQYAKDKKQETEDARSRARGGALDAAINDITGDGSEAAVATKRSSSRASGGSGSSSKAAPWGIMAMALVAALGLSYGRV